jgi:hypothetical protein
VIVAQQRANRQAGYEMMSNQAGAVAGQELFEIGD